jgi:hypothetical protein
MTCCKSKRESSEQKSVLVTPETINNKAIRTTVVAAMIYKHIISHRSFLE